jgi:hypothetical protein
VQHFFPWWWEESYERKVEPVNLTEEELELMMKHGLNAAQIAFRREMRSQFRNRFPEEYAEDAGTCFFDFGQLHVRRREAGCSVEEAAGVLRRARERQHALFPRERNTSSGWDPAGGGSDGDRACAQVIDVEKGRQCAELPGHYTLQELAAKVARLAQNTTMRTSRWNATTRVTRS